MLSSSIRKGSASSICKSAASAGDIRVCPDAPDAEVRPAGTAAATIKAPRTAAVNLDFVIVGTSRLAASSRRVLEEVLGVADRTGREAGVHLGFMWGIRALASLPPSSGGGSGWGATTTGRSTLTPTPVPS